jgi:hypothetical protein
MNRISEQLFAYVATLIALVLVMVIAFGFSAFSGAVLSQLQVFGLGTVTGGLIGLMRGVSGVQAPAPQVTPPAADGPHD